MRKVLVITYYWPPEQGVGVQRILKFCEHLPSFGFQLVVLTVSNNPHSTQEVFNGVEVRRVFFWFDPVRWFTGGNKQKSSSAKKASSPQRYSLLSKWIDYILNFCWLNFFIPDSKIGWYFPARKAVDVLMKEHCFDAIITTGPPYTAHLIGLYAKNNYSLPWVVDARDPWVENVNYNYIKRFGFIIKANDYLERKVYAKSDRIITIGPLIQKLLQTKTSEMEKVKVIYNGYDEEEFADFRPVKNSRFKMGYYGSILNDQIPYNFLKSLQIVLETDKQFSEDFLFDFYGPVADRPAYEIGRHLPEKNFSFHDSVPRRELIKKLAGEQVLFLLIPNVKENELVISSKIFEYVRAGWPVLIIGPVNGEAGNIIRLADTGNIFEYADEKGAIEFTLKMYHKWKAEGLRQNKYANPLFERKQQAKQLAQLFDELLENIPKP